MQKTSALPMQILQNKPHRLYVKCLDVWKKFLEKKHFLHILNLILQHFMNVLELYDFAMVVLVLLQSVVQFHQLVVTLKNL